MGHRTSLWPSSNRRSAIRKSPRKRSKPDCWGAINPINRRGTGQQHALSWDEHLDHDRSIDGWTDRSCCFDSDRMHALQHSDQSNSSSVHTPAVITHIPPPLQVHSNTTPMARPARFFLGLCLLLVALLVGMSQAFVRPASPLGAFRVLLSCVYGIIDCLCGTRAPVAVCSVQPTHPNPTH